MFLFFIALAKRILKDFFRIEEFQLDFEEDDDDEDDEDDN